MKKVYLPLTGDLFHVGHLRAIKQCSYYGEVYIGLLTDEAILGYKGHKPIIPYDERAEILYAIPEVMKVIRQESIAPDLAGMDYIASGDGFQPEETRAAEESGCELLNIKYDPRTSSTKIKEKIKHE